MAYTGTGTQADPAIPGTYDSVTQTYDGKIADLLEIFSACTDKNVGGNTSGSYYVKLCNDIECSTDENYDGFISNYLDLSCVIKFYSDDNKFIRGLTSKNNECFIKMKQSSDNVNPPDPSTCLIENISFLDCIYKPLRASSSGIFSAQLFYGFGKLKSVTWSMICYPQQGGYYPNKVYQVNIGSLNVLWNYGSNTQYFGPCMEGCSFYIKYIGDVNSYTESGNRIGTSHYISYSDYSCMNNVFIIDGATVLQGYGIQLWNTDSYNSFIFNNCKFMYSPVIMLNGGTNNYIAILNPNIDSNLTKPISLTGSGNSYSIFAADTSVYDVDIVKGTDVTNSIYYATLSELSDENYLMSINFIP